VIIPVFNGADCLAATLDALLRNSLDQVEILVVDDASTDSTPELLGSHPGADQFRVIRNPVNLGPSGARNRGAAEAGHPFLFFLDADVEVPERTIDWLRETLDLYSHRPDVGGVLGCYSEDAEGGFFARLKNLETAFLYRVTETRSPFLHTAMLLIRKDVLDSAGGFDASLRKAEDFKLGAVLGSRGWRFIIDRRIRGKHRKGLTWSGLLREDWDRIRSLGRIQLSPEEKKFSVRAHRWNRIVSLLLPAPVMVVALTIPWLGIPVIAGAAALLLLFVAANLRFLVFLRKRAGIAFALRALPAVFLEMLWASCAVAVGLVFRGHPQPGS